MPVEILLGAPIETIDADTIRNLRAADGSKPCGEGLRAALRWIGSRSLPLTEAVAAAKRSSLVRPYVDWALKALGSGDGDGYGYGSGSGYGYGYGDGDGYGYGYGSGSGYGYGYGDGSGDGSGYGYGSGDGSGYGSGYGDEEDD